MPVCNFFQSKSDTNYRPNILRFGEKYKDQNVHHGTPSNSPVTNSIIVVLDINMKKGPLPLSLKQP